MKKKLIALGFLAAALNAAAALTVTETSGVDAITLAFDAAADARELWCAWDGADKGAGFAGWANSERVAVVEADATTLTVALPADARRAAFARFFLFAGGASYPCAFIRGTGTQCIDTGFRPTPNTAIGIDVQLENPGKVTQLLFGAYGSFFVAAYSNGSGAWAWAFRDDSGNWESTHISASGRRTSVLLDGPGDLYTLAVEGTTVHTKALSAVVALDKRTKTSDATLALLAKHEGTVFSNFAEARLYGATIDEAGVRQHTYVPYVSAGVAGVYDTTADAFLGNAGTGAFTPCGRGGDVSGAEAGEALDLDAVRGGPAAPEAVVVNVATGETMTFDGPEAIDYKLVKVGAGTLVLEGTRTFAADVVISSGVIRANWATSGLAGTHLGICNSGSSSASALCYFQETGSTFTATPGDSGAGTVELRGYAGIVPYQQDITVNLGGDGRTLKRNANGFHTGAFMLTHSGSSCNATLVNNIDLAGNNFETKGNSGTGTAFYTGYVTNSTSTSAGVWNFYGGRTVIVGTRGTANPRVDFYGYRLANHSTALVFSNAIIRTSNDFISGTASNDLAYTTLVNCDKTSAAGWTYSAGRPEATLTIDGGIFNGPSHFRVGHYGGNRSGNLVITNDATVFFPGILGMYTNTTYRQYGGSVTLGKFEMVDGYAEMSGGMMTLTNNAGLNVGMTPNGKLARFAMKGGSIYVNDSKALFVGSSGHGLFHQTGGEVSCAYYPCVGRYAGGEGRLNVHGGTFTHRNQNLIRIAELGTGVVSVANGGTFTDLASWSPMVHGAGSKGTLILSPDGTFETPQLNNGDNGTDSSVVFNGGTLKLRTDGHTADFLGAKLGRVTVSPYGGAIDTNGKGDFIMSRALAPSTDAGDLCEALAHRWSFKEGSLVDSVGGLVAVTNGVVDLEDGAIRLKGLARGQSCVNLGTTLLPTDGRGATIEVWVTPLSYKSWARVIAFGSGDGTVKDIYFSFNRGSSASPGASHFRIYGSGTDIDTDKALLPGKTYHVAVVLDPQLDGTFLNTAYVHDAETGELYTMAQEATSVGWTPAEVAQENGCWLGHSNSTSNPDPDARYYEVRVHHRPMSAEQVQASCVAGPDAVYYFRKKGEGSLTMTGANTYAAGTAVDAGTLKLAAGATLPATEMWAGAGATLDLNGTSQTARELGGTGTVKGGTLAVTGTIQPGGRGTVGTLALDGTALTSGTLVADTAADGTSDRLAVTGTLDLSRLSLALGDVTALDEDKVYTVATATAVTGTFAAVDVPKKWRVSVIGSQVKLGYANGTLLLFR
ncbi:MAG: autotransporter-associated beta strand repeat-containing protein [Kiritimatiellae bacterium]|nr:autotransporter-associated beta strand repeat-containing protein [Kiritimatiellia bacterium]